MIKILFCVLVLFSNSSVFASSFFYPESYNEGKSRFLKNAKILSSKYKNLEIGSIDVDSLTVDYFYLPALIKNKSLLVVSSGTHGPEGYLGSAIQAQFIESQLEKTNIDEMGILFIHGVNPWGFANNRRGTINNVNMNRNFSLSSNIFNSKNEDYLKMAHHLEVKEPIGSTFNIPAMGLLKEMLFTKGVNLQSLTIAIGKGQYTNEKGINYGGRSFETQTPALIKLLKRVTLLYKKIIHFDLHTGLGDRGVLHIMTSQNISKSSAKCLSSVFQTDIDKDNYALTPPNSKGFYEIHGNFADIIFKLNKKQDKIILGVTAEFGTLGKGLVGKVKTINRLIRENRGFFYGYANREAEKEIKNDYLELFNPSSTKWRKESLAKARYILEVNLKRFLNYQI